MLIQVMQHDDVDALAHIRNIANLCWTFLRNLSLVDGRESCDEESRSIERTLTSVHRAKKSYDKSL
jgi:hypothetical protein